MRRALRWTALGLLAALLLAATILGPRLVRLSRIGAGYVAKQMCSCLYVAERDFDGCRSDIPASMDRIRAEPIDSPRSVRASLFGLIERQALHHPGSGCTLE